MESNGGGRGTTVHVAKLVVGERRKHYIHKKVYSRI